MKFEYKLLKLAKDVIFQSKNDTTINTDKAEIFENELNSLGQEGWELIATLDPRGFLGLGDTGYCIFKRAIK